MTKRKELLFACLSICVSLTFFVVVAEIILRLLPVANLPLVVPVTNDDPVFHYTPNRSFVYSRDWDLHLANHGRVNNAGMVNDEDYKRDSALPLVAIVGDSYIEALMVPYKKTLQGRLAEILKGNMRFYSFGASGAPLSQYLIWARRAVNEYDAKGIIINVVGNDFDESHDTYKRDFHGFWLYVPDINGKLQLHLFPFQAGAIRSFAKYSALARYLFINLKMKYFIDNWRSFGQNRDLLSYAGNTSTNADEGRLSASLAIIDAFFRDLPEFIRLPPKCIVFTLDGFRYPHDAEKGAGTYFDLMRRTFKMRAEALGYKVIDLDPMFFADSNQHGQRFEDARDSHWNEAGHRVVADAIRKSKFLEGILAN
jgi:hypothetical protein